MKVAANKLFKSFADRLSENAGLLAAWQGSIYRVTTLDYPDPKSILAGKGSFLHGGRWNAMGSFPAVYGSTTDTVAVQESRANAEYAGIPYPFRIPRLVVAVDLRLERVLDLTSAKVRRRLGVLLEELRREDWRKVQEQGFEATTQALGRAALHAGAEGVLAPSARIREGINLVFFPQNLRPASRTRVWDAEKLAKLPSRASS